MHFKRELFCLALLLGLALTLSVISRDSKTAIMSTTSSDNIVMLNLGKGALSSSCNGYVLKHNGKTVLEGYISDCDFDNILLEMYGKTIIMNWNTYYVYLEGDTVTFIDRVSEDVTVVSKSTRDMETAILYYDDLRFNKVDYVDNVNSLDLQ